MGEHRQKVLISTPISNRRFSVVTTIYLPDILQNYTEVYSLSKCCVEICTISLKYRHILANMVCGKNMAQLQALMVNGGSNPVEICSSSAQSADAIRQSVRAGSQTSDQARAPTTGTIFFPFRFFLPGTFSIGTFF